MLRVVLATTLLVGCGRIGFGPGDPVVTTDTGSGDDAASATVDGFWIVEQIRLVGESTPRLRSDPVNGFRADAQISSGVYTSRGMALSNGFGVEIVEEGGQLTIDGDAWILAVDDDVWVAAMTWLDPDTLALRVDLDDPRTQGDPPPLTEITYRRTSPPSLGLEGEWVLTEAEYPGTGVFLAGTCFGDGADSSRLTATVKTSRLHVARPRFESLDYSGLGCVGVPEMLVDSGKAYLEVEGTTFQSWLETDLLGKLRQTGTIEEVLGGHRFVFTSCVPAGPCAEAPLMLELAER